LLVKDIFLTYYCLRDQNQDFLQFGNENSTMTKEAITTPRQNNWTFLTNHSHVLICIARDPEVLLKDVADAVGITERAVQRIVQDLEEAGYLERSREGRRNKYKLKSGMPLRHPVESHKKVSELIKLVG